MFAGLLCTTSSKKGSILLIPSCKPAACQRESNQHHDATILGNSNLYCNTNKAKSHVDTIEVLVIIRSADLNKKKSSAYLFSNSMMHYRRKQVFKFLRVAIEASRIGNLDHTVDNSKLNLLSLFVKYSSSWLSLDS
jgi:hypothetical protein